MTVPTIEICLHHGPLPPAQPWQPCAKTAGALLCFDGIVREAENGQILHALDYETYSPMTETQLQHLAEQIVREFSIGALRAVHSVGAVPVGACSFRLQIASKHRKEGILACDAFIDRMKKVVPIWKNPIYQKASS